MSAPRPGDVASMSFDLSALVRRSVATLYSHLVTRPTGRALRVGIESQLEELGGPTLSILDFGQVVVLDYSCADEVVARLLRRFQPEDRPADVYFLARGIAERHREPIDEVLLRHGLALVAELEEGDVALLGHASDLQLSAWAALERLGRADAPAVAAAIGAPAPEADEALQALAARRVVLRGPRSGTCVALSCLLRECGA
ncbi:MAG TPA: hypothetical protein VF832_01215 [Longimicrobiales bacterium]